MIADTFSIIVKPNSAKNEITETDEKTNTIKINIKASPEGNKANLEIIKFFSKQTGKKVKIISGFKSRKKIIKLY